MKNLDRHELNTSFLATINKNFTTKNFTTNKIK